MNTGITEQLNQPEAHNYDEHIHTYENCCLVLQCPTLRWDATVDECFHRVT